MKKILAVVALLFVFEVFIVNSGGQTQTCVQTGNVITCN